MKVELDTDESWALLSVVVKRLLDEANLSDEDRASLRRWRTDEMRTNGEAFKALLKKINDDLERVQKKNTRSAIQKHDWV
jgi:hypothetical protein